MFGTDVLFLFAQTSDVLYNDMVEGALRKALFSRLDPTLATTIKTINAAVMNFEMMYNS